jgi:uncharacterized damage-inducible protein DinB
MAGPTRPPTLELARAELMRRLAAGPARLAASARRSAEVTSRGSTDGRWSARQNVAHLALVEGVVFQARLDQLAEDGIPTWSWTEPGTSDEAEMATLETALATFAAARNETVARVAGLDDAGWRRFGLHATYGRLDVAGLLEVIVDHDDHHRADIEALVTPSAKGSGATGARRR